MQCVRCGREIRLRSHVVVIQLADKERIVCDRWRNPCVSEHEDRIVDCGTLRQVSGARQPINGEDGD